MNSLDDMQLFVEVVKNKSFAKTAERLSLATSTVSLRIQKLERRIGLRLLNRTTRKIELTEAGGLYFAKAVQIVQEAETIHETLTEMLSEPSGTVRVSMPVDFAYQAFVPLAPLFYQQFPKITLDIDTSSRVVDLIGEPFDVALRMGEPKDINLIARKLATYHTHLYASPDYLTAHGTPRSFDELAQHQCLAFRQEQWRLFCGNEEKTVAFHAILIGQSLGLLERLAKQGMGIALLPDIVVRNHELQRILPEWSGLSSPLYAVTSTRLLPKKVQVFIDFLRKHLGDKNTG